MSTHKKTAFIREVVRVVQSFTAIGDNLANLKEEYFDNGYDGAGSDTIVDSNLTNYDISAADFVAALTLLQQLENFRANKVVVQGDYAATLNRLRRAPV